MGKLIQYSGNAPTPLGASTASASPDAYPEDALPILEEPETTQAKPQMSEEEVRGALSAMLSDAVSYIDSDIGTARASATNRYNGAPYGDEEDGRSQVVSRDVRDTVQAILPSLMRMFFGPEHVAEFMPRGPEDVELAAQATEYVDYIIKCDNPGFMTLFSVFKDALVRKAGIVKWWYDTSIEVKEDRFTGLDEEAVVVLMDELGDGDNVELDVTGHDPVTGKIDIAVTRKQETKKFRVEAVPPEEFLINRQAKSIEAAALVAHRSPTTVSDLVAMGYDYDLVQSHSGTGSLLDYNQEALARNPQTSMGGTGTGPDDATRPVDYYECFARIDQDGDGIAELRRICVIGEGHLILANEVVSDTPFSDFCPDPEPHTFFGLSITDIVEDVQRIKTCILRNMLDSLAMSIHPRTAVVEGQVNIEDALNTEIGALIRMKAPGMAQPFALPFVGKEAFPMMDYMDTVKEDRTGISRAAAGLDPDALQSTTKAAVSATVNAAHQHIELIARIFAETGMKRLMRGLLRLVSVHQDKERVVRLRGKWVPISPAVWNADMDVQVNVAVGSGSIEDRITVLTRVAELQGEILAAYGVGNPLVGLVEYRNTLAKIIELNGFKDASQFFKEIDPNAPPAPPQQGQGGDQAAQLLAQAQAEQIKADVQMKQAELELKREQMMMTDKFEREKAQADFSLREKELELKYNTQVQVAQVKSAADLSKHNTSVAVDQEAEQMRMQEAEQMRMQFAEPKGEQAWQPQPETTY